MQDKLIAAGTGLIKGSLWDSRKMDLGTNSGSSSSGRKGEAWIRVGNRGWKRESSCDTYGRGCRKGDSQCRAE